MDTKQELIFEYLRDQTRVLGLRSKSFVFNPDGKARPKRTSFTKLNNFIDSFLQKTQKQRICILSGLRGAGKTTLLYQLYTQSHINCEKLFVSVDHIANFLKVSLFEFLITYENLMGQRFEELKQPLIIFLDEVQSDPDWAQTLKLIYERTDKVLIVATGSSALLFEISSDLARRSLLEEIHPLSFLEFLEIDQGIVIERGLGQKLTNIFLHSKNAKDFYLQFSSLEKSLKKQLLSFDSLIVDRFIKYGSLPFMLSNNNEADCYQQIYRLIDRIIHEDLCHFGDFSRETLNQVQSILYTLAEFDQTSSKTIVEITGLSKPTLIELFQALGKSKLIRRIMPYGSHKSQVNKISKYLFSAPAFRSMYFNQIGNLAQDYMGKLLEDLVSMYLTRIFSSNSSFSLTYDAAEGGADFILGLGKSAIICEVGSGKKSFRQISKSAKKVTNLKFTINITRSKQLKLSEQGDAVQLPLEYLLLTQCD